MMRQAVASVRVLRQPHIALAAVRVEIDCKYSTTGLTQLPSDAVELTVPQLITTAAYAHEERCPGGCDTTEAHAQGDQTIRDRTEALARAMRADLARNFAESVRN